jgi:glucose/arabinose dehydrogenase
MHTYAILKKMRRRSLALCLLGLVVLVACGAGDGDDDAAGTTAAPAAPAEPAPATTSEDDSPAAKPAGNGVRLSRIGNFDQPLYVTAPPGDRTRLFVVEQPGRIFVIKNGSKVSTPFLDLRGQVSCCGEQGLLSMAFAPDYATSKKFYVDYTDRSGDTQVVEYRASNGDRANAGTARRLLSVDQPESNHNGGQLQFGPDKLLYIGLGDGGGADDRHGSRGNGQNLGALLGKILRIDPDAGGGRPYTIPSSNPFRSRSGARPEIYLYGVRNPWRFTFDRSTGDLVIGDVGQGAREEITFFSEGKGAGKNLGWRPREGKIQNPSFPNERAPGAVSPQYDYSHNDGSCSVTGGYVGRDSRTPGLRGRYVFGDYCKGDLFSIKLTDSRATSRRSLGLNVPQLTSFGEDSLGRMYAVSQDGPVYRLVAR